MTKLTPFVATVRKGDGLQKLTANVAANDDRVITKNSCFVCGDVGTVGIGVFPLRGIKGDWYCTNHTPSNERRNRSESRRHDMPLDVVQPLSNKLHSNILRLENISTGKVSEIDLSSHDKPRKKPKNDGFKKMWSQSVEIKATLPADDLEEIFSILKMQEHADARNREEAINKSTDRFCRCGALAETAWRTKDNSELWRCNECIERAEG